MCHIPHLGDFHVIESDSNGPASSLTSGDPCSPFQCLGWQWSSCLGDTTYRSDLWDLRFISHHHYQNTDYLNLALKLLHLSYFIWKLIKEKISVTHRDKQRILVVDQSEKMVKGIRTSSVVSVFYHFYLCNKQANNIILERVKRRKKARWVIGLEKLNDLLRFTLLPKVQLQMEAKVSSVLFFL